VFFQLCNSATLQNLADHNIFHRAHPAKSSSRLKNCRVAELQSFKNYFSRITLLFDAVTIMSTCTRNRRTVLSESGANATRCHNSKRKSFIAKPSAFLPTCTPRPASNVPSFDEEVYPILGTPPRSTHKAAEDDPFVDLVANTDALVRQIQSLKRRNLNLTSRIGTEKKRAANVEQMLRAERKKNILTVSALDG